MYGKTVDLGRFAPIQVRSMTRRDKGLDAFLESIVNRDANELVQCVQGKRNASVPICYAPVGGLKTVVYRCCRHKIS